jgi:hypothetical protein
MREGRTNHELPYIYSKISHFGTNYTLSIKYHPNNLTSDSAWGVLLRKMRLFVIGLITDIRQESIEAIPYIIGNIIGQGKDTPSLENSLWQNHREIHICQIDNFANIENYLEKRISDKDLQALKSISEKEIKTAFAEIINEPTIPKDWGGELSDLFSTMIRINNKNYSTAIAFKGPAKFYPMKMNSLGKNGDQIVRLFNEPAELLVLQHCHKIEGPVRSTMRAFAERISNPRMFCLIDGFNTLKILRTYEKCGLQWD